MQEDEPPRLSEIRDAIAGLHASLCGAMELGAGHAADLAQLCPLGLLHAHTGKLAEAAEGLSPALYALAEEVEELKHDAASHSPRLMQLEAELLRVGQTLAEAIQKAAQGEAEAAAASPERFSPEKPPRAGPASLRQRESPGEKAHGSERKELKELKALETAVMQLQLGRQEETREVEELRRGLATVQEDLQSQRRQHQALLSEMSTTREEVEASHARERQVVEMRSSLLAQAAEDGRTMRNLGAELGQLRGIVEQLARTASEEQKRVIAGEDRLAMRIEDVLEASLEAARGEVEQQGSLTLETVRTEVGSLRGEVQTLREESAAGRGEAASEALKEEKEARKDAVWQLEQSLGKSEEAAGRAAGELVRQIQEIGERLDEVSHVVGSDALARVDVLERRHAELEHREDELAESLQQDLLTMQEEVDRLLAKTEERRAAGEQRVVEQMHLIPAELLLLREHMEEQCEGVKEHLMELVDRRQQDMVGAFESKLSDYKRETEAEVEEITTQALADLEEVNQALIPSLDAIKNELLDEAQGIATGIIEDRVADFADEEARHTKAMSRLIENRHKMLNDEFNKLKRELVAEMEVVAAKAQEALD